MGQDTPNDDRRDSDPALDRTVRLPSQADRTISHGPPSTADSEPTLRPAARPSEPTLPDGAAAAPIGARRFGKFILLEELGSGGMGTVYRARQTDLDRVVALKVLHGAAAAGASLIERFQREARAAARLDHAGIVRVYEVGEADGVHFFTMELVDGENLLSRVRHDNPPLQERVRWVRDAARALHYAHENGLVHRDVKPHNILVTAGGDVKVADFGLARDVSAGRGLTVSGEVMGTPQYMAPEQARGLWDQVGPRADVYSLGATLYELIAGAPPVEAPEILRLLQKVAAGDLVSLRSRAPSVPRDLETIVVKALDADPARRYTSAGALAEDLDRFLRFEAILARPETWLERTLRRVKRNRRRLLAALGVVAAAAGIVVFLQAQGRKTDAGLAATKREREKLEAMALYKNATDPAWVFAHGGAQVQRQILGEAITLSPTFAEPCYRLGLVHEWTGDEAEAMRWYREAVRRSPEFIQARAHMATLALIVAHGGDDSDPSWRQGARELASLELEAPDDPQVRLVRCHMDAIGWEGATPDPARVVKEVEGLVEQVPDARLLLAGLRGFYYHPVHQFGFPEFRAYRDLGAAHDLLEALVTEDPLHIQARMSLGLIRYELGDLTGAERDFRFVATHAPSWDAPHYFLGRALASQRRLPEAIDSLGSAIRIDPDLRHVNYLGIVLGLAQRYEEALRTFDDSLAKDPENGDAIALKGMTLFCLGREAEAEAEVRRYVSMEPEYVATLREVDDDLRRPEVQLAIGMVRKHLLEFQDILFLAPKEKELIRTSLAAIHGFPRFEDMIARIQESNSVRYELQDLILNVPRYEREIPKMGEFLTWLGKRLGFRADLHQTTVLTEFCVKVARDQEILRWTKLLTARDYLWRAGTRYRNGDIEGARRDLQAALDLEGGNARAHYGLATIFALEGDAARCADALSKARQSGWSNLGWIATDPDFAKVRDSEDVKAAVRGD